MESIQEIAKRISRSGLKITPQRIAVMQSLNKLYHPKAEEIYREVSAKHTRFVTNHCI
jgi:Fe2+ or Zn2+ uptake regulation protein